MPQKTVDLASEGNFEGKIKIRIAGKKYEIIVKDEVLSIDGKHINLATGKDELTDFLENADIDQENQDAIRIIQIRKQLKDETIDNKLRNDLLMELSGLGEDIEED